MYCHNGSMTTTQTVDPLAHDTKTAALHEQVAKYQRSAEAARDRVHRMARDRKEWIGREQYWKMTWGQAVAQVNILVSQGDAYDPSNGRTPSDALAEVQSFLNDLAIVQVQIADMEKVYRANPWQRFFPCMNADGHIHSSYRGCPSVRFDTAMAWYPQLSGKTVEDAVNELGPALCSICFPAAPVEHKSMTLGQVEKDRTRTQREAAKAEREAKKAAKNLTPEQQFNDYFGWKVTTVAGAKKALRDEVELRDYYRGAQGRHDAHCNHPAAVLAAEAAKTVLIAREAAHTGHGATSDEVARIIATAEKRARREGARL